MHRIILIIIGLLTSLESFSLDSPIIKERYDACLDCTQAQAKTLFKNYLQQFACHPDDMDCALNDSNSFIPGHIFTGTGADFGFSFQGRIEGSFVFVDNLFSGPTVKAKYYYNQLQQLRTQLKDLQTEANNRLAAITGYHTDQADAQLQTVISKNLNNCSGHSSPFSFFLSGNSMQIKGEMLDIAQQRQSNIVAVEYNVGVTVGNIAHAGVTIVTGENNTADAAYGNGGRMVFQFVNGEAILNLGASRFGTGLTDHVGQPMPSNVPVSHIIGPKGRGGYAFTGNTFYSDNPCIMKEMLQAMADIGQDITDQFSNADMSCSDIRLLATTPSYRTYTFTEYIIVTRMIGNVVYASVHPVERTVQVELGSDFNQASGCG